MNEEGIRQMQSLEPAPAPRPVDLAAHEPAVNGELVERRRLVAPQWQHIIAAYNVLLDSNTGRVVTDLYEVFRDDERGVHIVIPPAAG